MSEPKMGERYPDWGWCWRCNQEVALMTEEQQAQFAGNGMIDRTKAIRKERGVGLQEALDIVGREQLDLYEQLTGCQIQHEEDQRSALALHISEHVLESYGAPCQNCGKLLRAPRASFCAECGYEPATGAFVQDRKTE